MRRLAFVLIASSLALSVAAARADEGVWTFDRFPSEKVKQRYGFAPTQAWLDHVRLSSVRLARGCSGSFVSPSGLVMTNHHCAVSCIEQLSTRERDYVKSGFYAKTSADEVRCPEVELNVLVGIEDVSARIAKATQGLADQKFNEAQKAEMTQIEGECAAGGLRCDVVTLYHGGIYSLYKYKRYQDVRLVFAPEFAAAFFGGDPDNFMFPRYDLDVSFMRAYENGQPAKIEHSFKWSAARAKENELVFVSGHPGSTQRLLTVAQLEYLRDVDLPDILKRLAELRGLLTEFGRRGPEQQRISQEDLFYVENGYKALNGEHEQLLDKAFFAKKVAAEQALRARVAKDPAKRKLYGSAWGAVSKAQDDMKKLRKPLQLLERGNAFRSDLFRIARTLVRGAEERPKPDEKRLREFRESAMPSLTQELFSSAPIYPELEELRLSFGLTKLRERLGADDPVVRKILGKESPESLAHALAYGSKLADVALRKTLWEGGQKAVDASNDPMIRFARLVDPDARAIRKKYEDQVEAPEKKGSELIAKALFELEGTSTYPDATFTLRLTYGAVKGYEEDGKKVAPFTTFGGAFERATGQDPFALPQSWLDAKPKLALDTPLNLANSCDVLGGNSGSPVVNKDAEIVGLIFDGNIQSLAGAFMYDESQNRAIAVHSAALIEALRKIYGADRLVQELLPPKSQLGSSQRTE